jgi:hypothetical protein
MRAIHRNAGWFALVLAVVVSGFILATAYHAGSSIKRWLCGDPKFSLVHIKFSGQQREASCRDPIVMSYLNGVVKNAKRSDGSAGELSYRGWLEIENEVSREVVVGISKDHAEIEIGVPKVSSEYQYWSIPIGKDAPKELLELLTFLTDEKFRGQRSGVRSSQN